VPWPSRPVASLRWLALKLGVEDYELLAALSAQGSRSASAARRLCRGIIRDATHFTYDTASVRQARIRCASWPPGG